MYSAVNTLQLVMKVLVLLNDNAALFGEVFLERVRFDNFLISVVKAVLGDD
jgi:hypothetical protein